METRTQGEKVWLLLFCWLLPVEGVFADCDPWAAKVVSVQGQVEAKAANSRDWQTAGLDDTFCPGDTVQVGENSRAALVLPNDTLLRLDQNTTLILSDIQTEAPSLLDLLKGILHIISRVPRSLKVDTPYVNAAIEGTEFVLAVQDDTSMVTVFEGTVRAANDRGDVALTTGESARTTADTAPRKVLLATPRDAVHWALYFPPIVDPTREVEPGDPLAANALRESQSRLANNDPAGALASLEAVPAGARDSGLHTYRASLYLYTGQVTDARAELQRALTLDPSKGDALALQAIIALVLNNRDEAQRLADAALQATSDSDAVHIARSYVQQAAFDLPAALASAQRAVELNSDNALAWARVSELQLAQGFLRQAQHAADSAAKLNPDLAMIQTTLGFAHLAQIRLQPAIAAFEKAIAQDQVNPLPRLGLGLAKIRRGKLAAGRRDIEIAASLDPNNSIVRSYLGKAYYEERRGPLDETQFDMAKELDPKDPTPWFYNAIRKQSVNRPVEALQDIQKSIELNDNRAVFRSSLQLDQDEAARSASLARIYNDLGFGQLALEEGWKSVNTDPANSSAHRLLADSYSNLPRHEIARVSELLQAQLLQPLNKNPTQPQLAEANLGILDGVGPSDPSTSEFNPLFTRNGFGLQFNAIGGSSDTVGNDLVVSGLYDKVAFSLGQFHFETDGFRANNDLQHDIHNVFFQANPTAEASIQIEYRTQDTETGDLLLKFDPEDFRENYRRMFDQDTGRIGFRYRFAPQHDLLASFIRRERDENEYNFRVFADAIAPGLDVLGEEFTTITEKATTAELQYLYRSSKLSIIGGAGQADADRTETRDEVGTTQPPLPPTQVFFRRVPTELDIEHANAYVYSTLEALPNLSLTLGLSYDSFDRRNFSSDRFNPKLGAMLRLQPATLLRLAAFSTTKRPLAANQTIEPSQVAGFNQFFDDFNGSETQRYGAAIEHRFSPRLFGGLEGSWRFVEIPVVLETTDNTTRREQDEQAHRAYIYWTLNRNLALSAEYFYERFEAELIQPDRLETQRLPLGLNFHSRTGFFARVLASHVDQEITNRGTTGQDSFWVVDASLGFRIPKRLGLITLGAKNLFNEQFNYHDLELTGEPRLPLYRPERLLFAKWTFSYQ